jgi:malonyl-CoA/methylmalonyl-CoA synthetase
MLSNAVTLKDYWGWTATGGPTGQGDVLIHALPIFHVHGLFVAIHGALINGSKMIWMAKFDPKRAIAHMAKATVFMGVPTLYVRMLAEPALNKDAVKNMRLMLKEGGWLIGSALLAGLAQLERRNEQHSRNKMFT